MFRLASLSILLALVMPSLAMAQDKGAVGLTMGYPSAVGIVWHATEDIAIRPEFTWARTTSEQTSVTTGTATSSTTWNLGGGASALFYVGHVDALRTYVSPRFTFTHAESDITLSGGSGATTSNTISTYALAGSFGAQYTLGSRFSVYGEVGLGYTHTSTESAISENRPESTNWGTRSGVGVVLYF